jgi:hypothetical protein
MARGGQRRVFGLAGAGLWALMVLAGACGEDAARPPGGELPADAGANSCELGSKGCECLGGSGCQDGLLCIAGRCLETEEPSGTEAPPRDRPRPNGIESNLPPDPEQPDAAAPDAASPGAGGTPDASPAGDPPPDAGDAG